MDYADVAIETRWIEISTNSATDIVETLQANTAAGREPQYPWLNHTVEDVYEYFKRHLRPADDHHGSEHPFSYFTFLVVDEECVKSEPYQCVSIPSESNLRSFGD